MHVVNADGSVTVWPDRASHDLTAGIRLTETDLLELLAESGSETTPEKLASDYWRNP